MPNKLRPKFNSGEHEDDSTIRRENPVRNFEVEIKFLKNKAIRDELKFKQIDNDMLETFTSKVNPNILESMKDLWKNECQKEELKSVEIWKRKQSWLERYEHRSMGRGFRFLHPPLFSTTPPPFFSKFSYKSFLFQNFHNHSFFLHLTISVDVIHHE